MNYLLFAFGALFASIQVECMQCHVECPLDEEMVCGFDDHGREYKMFQSKCALKAYTVCSGIDFQETSLRYCIKNHLAATRRMYGESCPVFCPNHYRPVCGASKYRDYVYRTFTNGCYLDMLNCRGDDDYSGYVEVPLSYCQRHAMKNIFRERLVMSNIYDTKDYV